MPLRHIDGADLDYHLVLFDSQGVERPEGDGRPLSAALRALSADGVTDVFLCSHGWHNDVPGAIASYDQWIAAMAGQTADLARARALDPAFRPLIVAVHWPSLAWGTEGDGAALLGDDPEADPFAAELAMSPGELAMRYAERIADTPAARRALADITAAADDAWAADDWTADAWTADACAAADDWAAGLLTAGGLPPYLEDAYQTLFAEAGLGLDGAGAAPGDDQQVFSPAGVMAAWGEAEAAGATGPGPDDRGSAVAPVRDGPGTPGLLGDSGPRKGLPANLKNALLTPLRQLSFWTMKRRARRVGETGVHALLASLRESAPGARFHLMGHSFGCIVACAAITGPIDQGVPADPVHSLLLAQGALSLWSFAEAIPFPPAAAGYFRPLGGPPPLVTGPIVATTSRFDHAVGTFYPLAARLGNERLLGDELPEFGGVGAFGIQGIRAGGGRESPVLGADADYGFDGGVVYNIEASAVIRRGGWPAGAHGDIAHPEIAHLCWQAALSVIETA